MWWVHRSDAKEQSSILVAIWSGNGFGQGSRMANAPLLIRSCGLGSDVLFSVLPLPIVDVVQHSHGLLLKLACVSMVVVLTVL